MNKTTKLTLRPYQLLCVVCCIGMRAENKKCNAKIEKIRKAIEEYPDIPVTLKCNIGSVFNYQDPGHSDDTPESNEFNIRRDLEILHKINLMPGSTVPARILFYRVFDYIKTLSGICSYNSITSKEWKGCSYAENGYYRKGLKQGLEAIIPFRTKAALKKEKQDSLNAMYKAGIVETRPHIVLCSVCQYGAGARPPFEGDNLPELLQLIFKKPDTRLRLMPHANWMMCAPCVYRVPEYDGCVNNKGSGGLPNELRDLRVLQKVGLTYGSVINAIELYKLIFQNISGTLEICATDHLQPSVWYTGCGEAKEDKPEFIKGRELLKQKLNI
jgi:hypothetical protein